MPPINNIFKKIDTKFYNMRFKIILIICIIILISACSISKQNESEDLRQKMLDESENRPKLTNNIEVISIIGINIGNKINDFEMLIRLNAGSDSFDVSDLSFDYGNENVRYVESEICDFDAIESGSYCIEVLNGNEDTLLEDNEVLKLKYKASESLTPTQEYGFIFSINDDKISQAKGTAPDSYQTTKIPLWPIG